MSRTDWPTNQIDLHMHSTVSDGTLPPDVLVRHMADAGISLLALTDHDTVAGLPAARAAAQDLGVTLVPGVELSARWERQTVHVVGLGIDADTPALQAHLAGLAEQRTARAATMARKLEQLGVDNVLPRVRAAAGVGQITRTHFARLLVEDGRCKDLKRAFKQYLGAGKPAWVASEWPPLDATIACIHAAGGRAVLAHPMRYKLTATKRRALLAAFADAGGDALEVHCGPNTPTDDAHSAELARAHGLMGSVGSDFHDPAQTWIKLGRQRELPADIVPVWRDLLPNVSA